ncbi:hypothetical protein HMPREF9554_01054 [Treponema phagedenis F0421]|nr:hypothetical protein HMPREF9554_01054 [Treponema phagedenis F0421]
MLSPTSFKASILQNSVDAFKHRVQGRLRAAEALNATHKPAGLRAAQALNAKHQRGSRGSRPLFMRKPYLLQYYWKKHCNYDTVCPCRTYI